MVIDLWRLVIFMVHADKTLEELENDIWTEEDFPTALVRRCFLLRKKRLQDFTPEDLRLMLTQKIGVQYLVPHVIGILKEDILAEGDYYPADLLHSILNLPVDFWLFNKPYWRALNELIKERNAQILNSDLNDSIKNEIFKSIARFQKLL